jgi:23S rRNA (guanosine2251-2'-O)-methyltransferase
MIIEGKNSVYEALVAGKTFNKLMVARGLSDEHSNKIIDLARKNNVSINFVERKILDRATETGRHQGFIAEITDFVYSEIEDVIAIAGKRGEQPFVVILDNIEDPHNLGSIVRVCECAGVHGIVIPKQRACAVNATVLKTSAGACNHLPICRVANINQMIEKLKKEGFWIYCADMDGEYIYKTNLTGPVAVVIGSEGKGVSKLTKQLCDGVIKLPMYGKVNSLNASTATSAVVYEIVRQRNFK